MVELSFSDDGGHADVGFAGDTLSLEAHDRVTNSVDVFSAKSR